MLETPEKRRERRRVTRACLSCRCPTVLKHKAQQMQGVITDVSEYGAQLKVEPHVKRVPLAAGDLVALDVTTPYGKSSCTAKVRWTETTDAYYVGVEFTKLPHKKDDPLAVMLDDLCCHT